MRDSLKRIALAVTALLVHDAGARVPGPAKLTEAEAAMFTASTGYEQFMGRWSRLLAPEFVKFAGVKDGMRVLDVGTGTGALASAVETTLPASEVVGIDPSAGFIDYARRSTKSRRSSFEVGDAQALRFADASFDQTMSLLVINFIPDHDKAIGEMRRVTRPGGVVSACVWDYDAGMEMLRFFWDEVVALDPTMTARDERNMKLTRAGQLGALWKKAGLLNAEEMPLVIEQKFSSFDDYWRPYLNGVGPAGAYAVSLGDPQRRELEARMRTRLLGNRQDGAFTLRARAWCVRGVVPRGK